MDDISACCTSGNSETMCCSSASSGDGDGVAELSTSLSGQLKINGGNNADSINGRQESAVDRHYTDEEDEEDEDEDGFSEEALLAQMGYAESDPIRDYEEEEEEEEDLSESVKKHEPINIPRAELNLVSALKGSREKEGRGADECRVSWAPDVYDPPCTADDHFAVSPKNERYRVEHKVRVGSGKNKQKRGGAEGGSKGNRGGGSAAGGSKDKKKAEKKHKRHGHNKYSDPG